MSGRERVGSRSERPSSRTPSERASADLLIDRQRLSEVLGREVRATRLRFKPGLSTTAVLLDAVGDDAPGWIQVSHPRHLDKLRNAVGLAQQRGQAVHVLEADGLSIAHGTIDTDPRLQKGLDAVRATHPSVTEAVNAGQLRVLRYNPQRRLVLRQDDAPSDLPHTSAPHPGAVVLRVTADAQRGVRSALAALASADITVVQPLRTSGPRNKRVSVWPWFGRGDLASLTSDAHAPAHAAGIALAHLHLAQLPAGHFDPVPDTIETLAGLAADHVPLDRAAAERLGALVAHLAGEVGRRPWATGLTHGDFSADQVLVGGAGEDTVALTDFDRAGHGPLLADLGSFAAAELLGRAQPGANGAPTSSDQTLESSFARAPESLPLTRALLAGYATAGGPALDQGSGSGLRLWTARALLTRVQEPFRSGQPDWVAGLHHRLDQVSEVLR